ncbi:hypothetical protein O77CONTIG1_04545 [Leptolyngbya sp. O-77]|nr:hypothetical protein O77CONTIG1_04545 [Leptolyngbya sp. O-77]
MGLSLLTYSLLGISGVWMRRSRRQAVPRSGWLRSLHLALGGLLVLLVLLLLTIGLVGTLGYYGSLGHSVHLVAGLTVVALVLLSAGSATQIGAGRPWARSLHIGTNLVLLLGFLAVSLSGWSVVQKYLP